MAGSVNKVILVGNLGKNPEIRTSQSGQWIASFSIATSERWTDKGTGEKRERTEWHQVVIFNENLVRVAEQFLRKGTTVYLEGSLATRKWQDQAGADRYTTEVVLKQFRGDLVLLESRGGRPAPEEDAYGTTRTREPTADSATRPAATDLDDEIPF